MDARQAELYRSIQQFQIDSTGSFPRRLSEENGWSCAFAEEAIVEYRKFLLLAAIAGHPVSPSDVVDQVWHLHLLYTRSYWDELCTNVLQRPLHHEPAGAREDHGRADFQQWYSKTLASYRRIFHQQPPAPIWPPIEQKRVAPPRRFCRVDLARSWVVPKTRVKGSVLMFGLIILLIALASGGCAPGYAAEAPLNPFDLRGPQFLVLYVVASATALAFAWMIRSSARGSTEASLERRRLHPYEIAYLSGGAEQALNAAVAYLVARQFLTLDAKSRTIRAIEKPHANLHPLESVIAQAAQRPASLRVLGSAAARNLNAIAEQLRSRGLLIDRSVESSARAIATLVALSVPAVGIIKICVGVSRGKPVAFLMIACAVSIIVSLLAFARPLRRTRRGDAALKQLTTSYADLRRLPAVHQAEDMALAVALFGATALSTTELATLRRVLQPPDSGGYSGCAASCGAGGSGGCGGGGGCGGCGGGCGGG